MKITIEGKSGEGKSLLVWPSPGISSRSDFMCKRWIMHVSRPMDGTLHPPFSQKVCRPNVNPDRSMCDMNFGSFARVGLQPTRLSSRA